MVHRIAGALVGAVLAAVTLRAAGPSALPGARSVTIHDGYEWWNDCSDVPMPFEFLPIYLGSESPGFVDLGRTVTFAGARWWAVQYTRDKDFGPIRAVTGQWYGGVGAHEWPSATVPLRRQLEAFRVISWEIDGNRHAVDPSCLVTVSTDDVDVGFFNAWVRFTEAGIHTVRITARQVDDFYFVFPFAHTGLADPFGLDGRRVFLRGEAVGDLLDGDFVHSYELFVARD